MKPNVLGPTALTAASIGVREFTAKNAVTPYIRTTAMLGGMFLSMSTPFVYQLRARPILPDMVQLSTTIATISLIATNLVMISPVATNPHLPAGVCSGCGCR